MISIDFTEQEAQTLLQILMQTPLPATVSQPLIAKVGQALQQEQQRGAGPRVVSDAEIPQ